jgi:acetyl esterase/lipase
MSFVGSVMRTIIRRHFNANPELCADQIQLISRLDRFNKPKTNRGYVIESLSTSHGAKYERIFQRDSRFSGKAVLYLHGGAYISGLTANYRKMARHLSQAAGGAEVYYLDYACAPARVFPSQLAEALDLWTELTEQLGYAPQSIIVGGDSAGGNLVLALLLTLRDKGCAMPAAAFCWSPWADMTASGESYARNYQKDVLFGNRKKPLDVNMLGELLKSNIYCFVGDADRRNPYVSPVFGEYHGFPPMFFAVGGDEMLYSDTMTIVDKLRAEGGEVETDVGERMFHVYPLFYSFLPEGKRAFAKTLAFIKAHC